MPDVDGIELLEHIRSDEAFNSMPVVSKSLTLFQTKIKLQSDLLHCLRVAKGSNIIACDRAYTHSYKANFQSFSTLSFCRIKVSAELGSNSLCSV